MELFLVTDPLLILIELLNFYSILSEGFLISVFGQECSCKKTLHNSLSFTHNHCLSHLPHLY